MLVRPVALNPAPSVVSIMLGGLVGGLMALSVLYSAPLAGWHAPDILRALGGVFTASPDAALGVGAVVYLLGAVLLLPLATTGAWLVLPGQEGSMTGTLIKGIVIAVGHWAILGVLLGLVRLAAGSGFEPAAAAGLLGFGAGLQGAILFAVASLGYGLALTWVAFVEQGISPVDAMGWNGFTQAASGPLDLAVHRSANLEAPGTGERPWRKR